MYSNRNIRQAFAPIVGAIVVGALILGVIGTAIYHEIAHPCVRYEMVDATCGGDTSCAAYGQNGQCSVTIVHPTYPCKRRECVERAP